MNAHKGRMMVVLVLGAVVVVAILIFVLPRGQDLESCQPPPGYTFVTGRMATDMLGDPIFIARGIYATGQGSPGGKAVTIPPCGSPDPALEQVAGVFVRLDGQQVFLAAGSVGRDVKRPASTPLVPTPPK